MFNFESRRQILPVSDRNVIYYTDMEEWKVLGTYTSEVEARVLESFLRAQGLEVQLLDTHMNAYVPSLPSAGRGMRLMVRAADFERAKDLIETQEAGSHLEIVGEEMPIQKSPYEKWIFVLILAAIVIVFLISHLS